MSIFRLISFFFEGSIQRNRIGFVGKGIKGEQCSSNMGCPEGKLPFGQRRPEHDRDAPAFSVGKNPKKPGGFVAGNPMRTASPWHTILLARSSVLYLLRRAATEGACDVVGAPCARLRNGNRFWRLPFLRQCCGAPPLQIEPASLGFDLGRRRRQDRRGLRPGWTKTQGLVRSKARLAGRGCVRLDGAKRKKSVRSRAAGGI